MHLRFRDPRRIQVAPKGVTLAKISLARRILHQQSGTFPDGMQYGRGLGPKNDDGVQLVAVQGAYSGPDIALDCPALKTVIDLEQA